MLEWLDTLIGFTLVMLVFSLSVTALTQMVVNWTNARGRHLRDGLAQLLMQVHPPLPLENALGIASTLLRHPLVSREISLFSLERFFDHPGDVLVEEPGPLRLKRGRLGTVIEREKFTKLLAGLVANEEPVKLTDESRKLLEKIMGFQDKTDADRTLRNVRAFALELEVSQPELATHLREAKAVASEMDSEFVARTNAWFDATVERVSARFVGHTRMVTLFTAILVVTVAQLDAIQLFNRIAVDPELRTELVRRAIEHDSVTTARAMVDGGVISDTSVAGDTTAEASPPSVARNGGPARGDALIDSVRSELTHLSKDALGGAVSIPSGAELRRRFTTNPVAAVASPGLILGWVLLSFGAPFWYQLLNHLLKLRPTLAFAEDQQREDRRTNQPIATPPAPARGATVPALQGERGDEVEVVG